MATANLSPLFLSMRLRGRQLWLTIGAILLAALLSAVADAAILVDPELTGAAKVTLGLYPEFPPYTELTNPVLDPFNAPESLLVVGNTAPGALEVNGGSDANVGQVWIGFESGAVGNMKVTGAGSTLTIEHAIRVGTFAGVGKLEILDGATVESPQIYLTSNVAGAPSRLILSGSDSKLVISDGLSVESGVHSVVLTSDGGELEVQRVDLGYSGSSSNSLAEAIVTSGSKWTVDGSLNIGTQGYGAMTISDAGEVEAQTVFLAAPTSGGPISLTLSDGTLRSGELYLSAGKLVGNGEVLTKGLVADEHIIFNAAQGLVQEVAIPGQPGVALHLDHSAPAALGAGYFGEGHLTITDGRQVVSTIGYLGYDYGSSGHAVVTGNSSRWETLGNLFVGRYGAGELKIESGGVVEVGGELLLGPSSGDQASRVILNGGDLQVDVLSASTDQLLGVGTIHARGLRLDGTLVFDQPGAGVGNLVLDQLPGQHVTFEFESPELSVLGVGYRGEGLLAIRNGAKVRSTSGALGHDGGGKGTAVVAGNGSEWVVAEGELVLGSEFVSPHATGKLQVVDGGLVQGGAIQINSDSQIEVAGVGSRVEAFSLDFGYSRQEHVPSLSVRSGATVSLHALLATGSADQLSGRIDVEGENSRIEARSSVDLDGVLVRVRNGGALLIGEGPGFSGGLNLKNSTLVLDEGMVDVNGGTIEIQDSQIVFEQGTLRDFREFEGDLWQTSGRVELGSNQTIIDGTYFVDEDATLQIALQMHQAPVRLRVNEFAVLAGTLEVLASAPLPDFAQPDGEAYQVLRAAHGILGEFTDYVLPELATGLGWSVLQTTNEIYLQIIAGDYNGNGIVDAADFTLWRNTENQQVAPGTGADGNRDGFVNQDDYDIWKEFFGQKIVAAAGSGAISTTATSGGALPIPEPTGILLLISAGFYGLSLARHRPV